MNRSRRIAAAAVGVAVLVPGAAAHAATRNVVAGPPAKVTGVPADSDSNAYFRKQVTIHVGDRVRWKFNGFHTVTVPPKGEDPPPFIGQDASGTKISGVNDAAGKPFWFNGQTRITLTDEGALSQGGRARSRSSLAASGSRPTGRTPARPRRSTPGSSSGSRRTPSSRAGWGMRSRPVTTR